MVAPLACTGVSPGLGGDEKIAPGALLRHTQGDYMRTRRPLPLDEDRILIALELSSVYRSVVLV